MMILFFLFYLLCVFVCVCVEWRGWCVPRHYKTNRYYSELREMSSSSAIMCVSACVCVRMIEALL